MNASLALEIHQMEFLDVKLYLKYLDVELPTERIFPMAPDSFSDVVRQHTADLHDQLKRPSLWSRLRRLLDR
jgi:hypothetical protein